MAKAKESTIPKAKEAEETKPAKAGIVKRTPVKASPVKLSRAKSVVPSEDILFMWKIMQMSAMKIDWPTMAKDAGTSVGTLQKRFSRLRIKIQQYLSVVASSESSGNGTNSSEANKDVDGSESPKKDANGSE
ncbi:hypothetical protein PENFLA_c011G01657 [Penicillium flavigenum]|uniref:Myb-like DNA-binding domain-containing protein n=1 Tax=Penicillium flavigenum TaxID=254877 RepID=A0A1V6TBK8_9EURO|nr:hypothetical protein PENFLA_c011G01657 [Penicillium flavigenum]